MDELINLWRELTGGYSPNDIGMSLLADWKRQFNGTEIKEAMKIAVQRYITFNKKGEAAPKSVGQAFSKIGGICFNRRKQSTDLVYKSS